MNLPIAVSGTVGRENPLIHRRESITAAPTAAGGCAKRRRAALKMVDRQLTNGNFKLALSLIKQLKRQPPPSGLRGFSAARQVPRRVSSVDQLDLSVTQTFDLQSLLDSVLDSVKNSLESSSSSSESCEDNDLYLEDDMVQHKQVVHHEAGHFLVGYLLGVLPKQYKFSSMEDKIADASVKFVGFEFLTELEDVVLSNSGHQVRHTLSFYAQPINASCLLRSVLSKLACVLVGGLVAEHLTFGNSIGHHRDVEKLYRVLNWLQYTEDEANILTRWAVLNTLTILNRHREARLALVEAMSQGRSIGICIDLIEGNLNYQDI
ncbi:hypothetical protein SSX86_003314 [Deinandra increscens subsp. villosa]|uniref:ATP-dependent Zn protease n=1 Tax=Deinandra increscens subsp. villosa TaxID=3103831 RepID=A0AAP0DH07_9ASTR